MITVRKTQKAHADKASGPINSCSKKPLILSAGHFFHPARNSFDASKSPPYNAEVSSINEFIPRNTTDALRGPARGYFNLGNGTSTPA
jgi:hypothetical protein